MAECVRGYRELEVERRLRDLGVLVHAIDLLQKWPAESQCSVSPAWQMLD